MKPDLKGEPVRRALMDLPVAPVPPDLSVRLHVIASHERRRRLEGYRWLERISLHVDHILRPFAVPAAGGLLASVLLFSALVDSLNVQRYLSKDVPLGVYTQVTVDDLSPFGANGSDVMVEVTIDEKGLVSDFSIPDGKVSREQLRQIGNLILYSTFTPATAFGQPVSGKILVSLHHINVRG